MCHTPELIVEITKQPVDILGVDAAILFSDILMVVEALNAPLRFEEEKGPVIDPPFKDLSTLSLKGFEERLSFLPRAISLLKKDLNVPLLGFSGAPFTLAAYLIEGGGSKDLKKTKEFAYQKPKEFEDLLQMLEEGVTRHLQLQVNSGVDALQLFDSLADHLTEDEFIRWSLSPLSRIASKLKVPLIFFCKGSCYRAKLIKNCAISIDWQRPIKEVRKEVPGVTLQGNLDPMLLFAPLEVIERQVDKILKEMEGDPAFIFNLGHGILPRTPVAAVKLLVQKVQNLQPSLR